MDNFLIGFGILLSIIGFIMLIEVSVRDNEIHNDKLNKVLTDSSIDTQLYNVKRNNIIGAILLFLGFMINQIGFYIKNRT